MENISIKYIKLWTLYPALLGQDMISFGLEFGWTSSILCMNYSFFAFKSTSLYDLGKAQVRLFYWACSNSACINIHIHVYI